MITSESDFQKIFLSQADRIGHACHVESEQRPGIPDINYIDRVTQRDMWTELKYWGDKKPDIRTKQIKWAEKRWNIYPSIFLVTYLHFDDAHIIMGHTPPHWRDIKAGDMRMWQDRACFTIYLSPDEPHQAVTITIREIRRVSQIIQNRRQAEA